MFNMMNTPSVADIAAVTRGNNDGGNDGWGGNNGWWILIILFALFGWGRNGNGFGGGSGEGSCCTPASCGDIQRGFDNQGVTNKLNGLENGLCSLGYDQLAQMNGINQNITQTAFGLERGMTQMGIAQMQDTNALSRQLADCCCENRAAVAQVRYDMATDTCSINTSIDRLGDRLEGRLTQMEMARKDEKIADQASQIQALNLAVSQRNQNDYLISQLRPCPVPAYITCNPWGNSAPFGSCNDAFGFGFGRNGSCGNGCGSCC